MRILAFSGSLRTASSNAATLQAMSILAPPGVDIVLYEGLARLPHFNPDLDRSEAPELLPPQVRELRRQVGLASGLLISSPEYAHGVAGSFKNALDWLVASLEFPGKPVALINTAPRAVHSDAQLREILATMSARVIAGASITAPISGVGRNLDAQAIAADPELSRQLRQALGVFVEAVVAAPE
ncbi:FMN reductase [Methylocystis heyeri]|uniref:FMN reductase n=1 Tax=Methylocystis heyeri TaxID=391905 RepID=A0A6B8KK34_9HYPH|nr:FMN reductase [Methylocystis heyeri]